MKYAVVILVVLLGVWLWRKNRADDAEAKQATPVKPVVPTPVTSPQIMLSCAVCGIHVPQNDALIGKSGSYCTAAHRQQREG